MCIASVIKGAITDDQIQRMADHNSDGGGLAWINSPGMIAYRKGLDAKQVIALVAHLPRPFLMHFRIATRGGKRPELTHPFPIGFEAFSDDLTGFSDRGVLIHNGSSSAFDHMLPKGIDPATASDTQIAAYVAGFDESVLDRLTWSNALLRPNGSICARGSWTVKEGNHYSNMLWESKPFVSMYGSRGSHYWDDEAYSEAWANWRASKSVDDSGPHAVQGPPIHHSRGVTGTRATSEPVRPWKEIKRERADAKRERKLARRAARRDQSDGTPIDLLDDRDTEPMMAVRGATIRQSAIPSVPRTPIVKLPAHLGSPSTYPPTVRGPQLDLMMGRGPACDALVGDPYDDDHRLGAESYTFTSATSSQYLNPDYDRAREQIARDAIRLVPRGTK